MKKQKPITYKMGDLIEIKERLCSDKVQPKIKVGQRYFVLAEGTIKRGAKVLKVVELGAMLKEAIKRPHDNIDPKQMQRINAERFFWLKRPKSEIQEEFLRFKAEFEKKNEEREMKFLEEKFTEQERVRMAYTPYLFAELAWHYTDQALNAARNRKVEKYKKVARMVKAFRVDFNQELRKKMNQPVLECAQSKLQEVLQKHSLDFFIFMTTVKNELNRQHVGLEDDDVKTYAFMAFLCCRSLNKIDSENIDIIQKKLKCNTTRHETYKYMKELRGCIDAYMDGCIVELTQPIKTAVAIMEKNIKNAKL